MSVEDGAGLGTQPEASELEDLRALDDLELGLAAPSVSPAEGLKARLLERVEAEVAAAKDPDAYPAGAFFPKPGVFGVRTAGSPWTQTPIQGLESKLLFQDKARGFSMRLLRFGPGTRYPRHVHAGSEEIYVLEGSVRINGVLLEAGDYCRSEAGVEEIGTVSETGGKALIVSCDADEVYPDKP